MILVLSCSCLCPIHCSQVLSRGWGCSWSSADLTDQQFYWLLMCLILDVWGSSQRLSSALAVVKSGNQKGIENLIVIFWECIYFCVFVSKLHIKQVHEQNVILPSDHHALKYSCLRYVAMSSSHHQTSALFLKCMANLVAETTSVGIWLFVFTLMLSW